MRRTDSGCIERTDKARSSLHLVSHVRTNERQFNDG
jgi:hypothetical protein